MPVEGCGGARRLARLLGHRAEGPLHPALLHLLAASPLHGRVYVPPPPPASAEPASAASAVPSAPVTLRAYNSGDEERRQEKIFDGQNELMDEMIDQRTNEGDGERNNERQLRPRGDIQGGGGSESRQGGAGADVLPLFPELAVGGVGGPMSAGGGFALSPSHLSAQTWSGAIAAQMTRTTAPTAPGNNPVPVAPGVPSGTNGTSASRNTANDGAQRGSVTRSEAKAVSEFAAAGLSAAAIAVMEKLTPKLRDAAKQALSHAHLLTHIFPLPPLSLFSFSLTSSLSLSLVSLISLLKALVTASATRRVAAAAAELAESNTIARAADKRVHRFLPTQLWQFFQVSFLNSLSLFSTWCCSCCCWNLVIIL